VVCQQENESPERDASETTELNPHTAEENPQRHMCWQLL